MKLVPKEETFGNNTELDLLAVAQHMTEGEILIRENKLDAGIAELREAIKLEDASTTTNRPAGSSRSPFVRRDPHAQQSLCRGRAGLPRRPREIAGQRLVTLWPGAKPARAKENPKEANATEAKFKEIWADADLKITSSCLCQPGKMASD